MQSIRNGYQIAAPAAGLRWRTRLCEHPPIAATKDIEADTVTDDRLEQLLADASAFFEERLWGSETSEVARETLAAEGLNEKTSRAFSVGYAPVGTQTLLADLAALGYDADEVAAAGLATKSVRGRFHAHFHSRLMFPIRDRGGRVLGFAGRALHLGPSWPLWVISPEAGLYRRSQAVFGLDRAAKKIRSSGAALVQRDCIEVLRTHQEGTRSAVAVHTPQVTREQALALADGLPGGLDDLELELAPGMSADLEEGSVAPVAKGRRSSVPAESAPSGVKVKRVAIVAATALATINLWTGAPLLAVWVGAQVQGGRVISLRGVVTVLAVLSVLAFLLAWVLAWLHARYDRLVGRPATLTRTSPWYRRMRGELDEQLRERYSLSAPERVVAASVIVGFIAFEIWFFFFAGSSLPHP